MFMGQEVPGCSWARMFQDVHGQADKQGESQAMSDQEQKGKKLEMVTAMVAIW